MEAAAGEGEQAEDGDREEEEGVAEEADGDGEVEQGERVDADIPEEAPIKVKRDPAMPTAEERQKHDIAHLPPRPWCPICVEARAIEDPHKRQSAEQKLEGLPSVSVDYCEIGENPDDTEDRQVCLVARDKWTTSTWARLVSCKGRGDDTVVKELLKFTEELGYDEMELKGDGEPALVDIMKNLKEIRRHVTKLRNPPAHDPQSNGLAERGVQEFKKQLRTVKLSLERRLKDKLAPTDAVITWMIPHACESINRFLVGHDGRTPYYRLRHKKFNQNLVEFGEMVHAKPMRSNRFGRKRALMARTVDGIWLGMNNRTNEHRVALLDGGPVIHVRTIFRKPEDQRWNMEAVKGIKATIKKPNPKDEEQEEPEHAKATKGIDLGGDGSKLDETPVQDKQSGIRDFRITKELLEKYGLTPGCMGCTARKHGSDRRAHTVRCRKRLEQCMRDDENEALNRRDRRIAGEVERNQPVPEAPERQPRGAREAEVEDVEMPDAAPPQPARQPQSPKPVEPAERVPEAGDDAEVSDDDDGRAEGPREKRRRLAAISASVKQMLAALTREDPGKLRQLCRPEVIEELVKDLDEKFVRKNRERLKRSPTANDKDVSMNDVSEAYSPPRIVAEAEKQGLRPGFSFDLTRKDADGNDWDLSKQSMQEKALEIQDREKPEFVIVSPPCTPFSTIGKWSQGRMSEEDAKKRMADGITHFAFAILLCLRQAKAGRYFILEHPVGASSWMLKLAAMLILEVNYQAANFDFCMLGMEAEDELGRAPARKRTKIATNSSKVGKALRNMQCDGSHRHVHLTGGRARACQVYPEKFCKFICAAIKEQLVEDRKFAKGKDVTREMINLVQADKRHHEGTAGEGLNAVSKDLNAVESLYSNVDFYDDISGKELDHKMAAEARRLEIEFFKKMKVYKKVPRWYARGHKVIKTRWLDVNKGDLDKPNYRARLVGCELKNNDKRLDLFAATPPLESLRMVASVCASNQDGDDPFRILSIDVKRAYFYAAAKRKIFIEVPIEDWEEGDEDNIAMLELSLYGTRDAAQNWSEEYTKKLIMNGFTAGVASPCNFHNPVKQLTVTVHGDDFTVAGPTKSLRWFEQTLSKYYDIKAEYLGPEAEGMKSSIRILNRYFRWSNDGIEYEPDQRHGELIIKQMGLEAGRPVATPGVAESETDVEAREQSEELQGEEATQYRALAARLNYLALDRADLQYSAKEISKFMAKPRSVDWLKIKRVGRYLLGAPRYVQVFAWQSMPSELQTYTDSDWAGDRVSRKSTSGGVLMCGSHLLKSWSSTQPVIALSSGEAELYALVRGATQMTGMMSLYKDVGVDIDGMVFTDSTAAIGISHRRGLGKTRHIQVQYLWIQEKIANKELAVHKVATTENPADLLTKHLKLETILKHVHGMGGRFELGKISEGLTIGTVGGRWTDAWVKAEDKWVRRHNRARMCLFTPMKVVGGAGRQQGVRHHQDHQGHFR